MYRAGAEQIIAPTNHIVKSYKGGLKNNYYASPLRAHTIEIIAFAFLIKEQNGYSKRPYYDTQIKA